MRKNRGRVFLLICLLLCLPGPAFHSEAKSAVKYPSGIRLNRTSATLLVGHGVKLKAALVPGKVAHSQITWKSSNEKVATVSASGKVVVKNTGTVKITARTENGKMASCTVRGVRYTTGGGRVRVATPSGDRTYRAWNQNAYGGYYVARGCVTTAVAIAASGFGRNYSPRDIHEGSSGSFYSERYACLKMGGSLNGHNRYAISIRLSSQVFTDLGIPNKAVYRFQTNDAIKEISAHLREGKPVLVKANNHWHNGVKLANGHHALVLVAIDDAGYVTWINPEYGRINYAHGSHNYCHMKLDTLVRYHMFSAGGNYLSPYVWSNSMGGGYLLLG